MAVRSRLRPLGRGLELPNLIESYLLTCRAEGKSPNTIRWYEQKLRALCDYLRARQLPLAPEDLAPEIVRGLVVHLQATGVSAFTTRGYVQVVKGLFTWLENEGYIADNPLRRVKLPKTPKYVVRPLDEDEVRRILSEIDPRTRAGARDFAIFLLLLDTGMRLGELAALTEDDGLQAVREGIVRVFGKGSRERMVPVGLTTQNAIRRYIQIHRRAMHSDALFVSFSGQALTAEGIRQVIRRLADRAGVRGVHPHRLRHTAAVTFLRAGGDVFSLQRILGHSTLSMTRNYVMLTDADVKAVHQRASPADRLARIARHAS
ncbi:MAG: tyrosine-type recombinase/integrase [Chloroflexi bacterium]|nr:tyrosine-type recombinase/integrase [Chloroflexota bacterium]